MLKTLKRFFETPCAYDHWDAPEIWRDVPQIGFERPRARRKPRPGCFSRSL